MKQQALQASMGPTKLKTSGQPYEPIAYKTPHCRHARNATKQELPATPSHPMKPLTCHKQRPKLTLGWTLVCKDFCAIMMARSGHSRANIPLTKQPNPLTMQQALLERTGPTKPETSGQPYEPKA